MLNVNGIEVSLKTKAPRKVARGWLHETDVFQGETLLGRVCEVTGNKHGGRSINNWVVVIREDKAPEALMHSNLNDLVNRYAEEQRYLSDPQAQVRDTRYYS